jgi:hypothetical protein
MEKEIIPSVFNFSPLSNVISTENMSYTFHYERAFWSNESADSVNCLIEQRATNPSAGYQLMVQKESVNYSVVFV